MLRDNHATLVAFDAAVQSVCRQAGELVRLASADNAVYPVAAALLAALADGPAESVGERLASGLGRTLDGEGPTSQDALRGEVPAADEVTDAEPVVREFLITRGLEPEAATDAAAAVTTAAAELVSTDYPSASDSAESAPDGDRTYGLS